MVCVFVWRLMPYVYWVLLCALRFKNGIIVRMTQVWQMFHVQQILGGIFGVFLFFRLPLGISPISRPRYLQLSPAPALPRAPEHWAQITTTL